MYVSDFIAAITLSIISARSMCRTDYTDVVELETVMTLVEGVAFALSRVSHGSSGMGPSWSYVVSLTFVDVLVVVSR